VDILIQVLSFNNMGEDLTLNVEDLARVESDD